MNYRYLGTTGIQISDLALGTMVLGAWGNTDQTECERIIHEALDAGINLVDTADVYAQGESEEIVGRALAGRRDDVILATKFWNPMGEERNRRGGSRRWITRAVESSLRRLRTDWIDLYQMHRPDPDADRDETLGALDDLVSSGKVRYLGSSTWPAELIVDAQWAAQRLGSARFVCEQPPYSILTRGIETSVLPTAARHDMGVLVWAPLNGGWLTGKYRRDAGIPDGSRAQYAGEHMVSSQAKYGAVEALATLASQTNMSLTQLSLAWVREHPAVTSAIIGPKTLEQLRELVSLGDERLEPDVLDRIDEIVAPGTNVEVYDSGWVTWDLDATRRRRG